MEQHPYVFAIVGSAAVGALVSSLITAVAQWRERISRREELLLAKAIELANHKYEATKVFAASRSGETYWVQDHIVMSEQYYQWLKHLMKHDKLPDNPKFKQKPGEAN